MKKSIFDASINEVVRLAEETFIEHYGMNPKHVKIAEIIPVIWDNKTCDFSQFGVVIQDPSEITDIECFPCVFDVHCGMKGNKPVDEEVPIFTIMGYSHKFGMMLITSTLAIEE